MYLAQLYVTEGGLEAENLFNWVAAQAQKYGKNIPNWPVSRLHLLDLPLLMRLY